jgi:hypothetical protein
LISHEDNRDRRSGVKSITDCLFVGAIDLSGWRYPCIHLR